jgi:hypothetical protein
VFFVKKNKKGRGGRRGDLFGIWCSQCILYGYFYYVPQVLNMFSVVVVVIIIIIIIITLNICVNNITLFETFFLENHWWGVEKFVRIFKMCDWIVGRQSWCKGLFIIQIKTKAH